MDSNSRHPNHGRKATEEASEESVHAGSLPDAATDTRGGGGGAHLASDAQMESDKGQTEYVYTDHSKDEAPVIDFEPPLQTFPMKLHGILSKEEYSHIISWLPHGRSWRIEHQKLFEEKVIPQHFRHARYGSFMRQVNGWGFKRVVRGPDYNSYYHELFLRGIPHLCRNMKRRDFAKTSSGSTCDETTPDFYAISRQNPLPNVTSRTTDQSSPQRRAVLNNQQPSGDASKLIAQLDSSGIASDALVLESLFRDRDPAFAQLVGSVFELRKTEVILRLAEIVKARNDSTQGYSTTAAPQAQIQPSHTGHTRTFPTAQLAETQQPFVRPSVNSALQRALSVHQARLAPSLLHTDFTPTNVALGTQRLNNVSEQQAGLTSALPALLSQRFAASGGAFSAQGVDLARRTATLPLLHHTSSPLDVSLRESIVAEPRANPADIETDGEMKSEDILRLLTFHHSRQNG